MATTVKMMTVTLKYSDLDNPYHRRDVPLRLRDVSASMLANLPGTFIYLRTRYNQVQAHSETIYLNHTYVMEIIGDFCYNDDQLSWGLPVKIVESLKEIDLLLFPENITVNFADLLTVSVIDYAALPD